MNEGDYNSNICIFIPCFGILNESCKANEEWFGKKMISLLTDFSTYECKAELESDIIRLPLGTFYLACLYDSFTDIKGTEVVSLVLSYHKRTHLGTLIIYIANNTIGASNIGGNISANEIYLGEGTEKEKADYVHIDEWTKAKCGLRRCGDSKTIFFMSKYPTNRIELNYILAGETYQGDVFTSELCSPEINRIIDKSISQYHFYDAYASQKNIAFIYSSFSQDPIKNLDTEVSAIFIVELMMLQYVAIARAKMKTIELLSDSKAATYKKIEQLYSEFGETARLWENSNYKFLPAQLFANRIYDAFGLSELKEDYKSYQEQLDKIVDIRAVRYNDRHNSGLNFILVLLAVLQVIPLFVDTYQLSSEKGKTGLFWVLLCVFVFVVLLIDFLVVSIKRIRE